MTFRLHECYDFRAVLSLSTEAERLGGPPGATVTNQLSAACFLFHSPLSYFIAFETFFCYSVELCPWWQCSKRTPPNSFLFSFILSFFAHALKVTPVLNPSVPHLHFSHFQPFFLILPMLIVPMATVSPHRRFSVSWGWFWPGTIVFSPAVWWNVFAWASPNILKHQLLSQFLFLFLFFFTFNT